MNIRAMEFRTNVNFEKPFSRSRFLMSKSISSVNRFLQCHRAPEGIVNGGGGSIKGMTWDERREKVLAGMPALRWLNVAKEIKEDSNIFPEYITDAALSKFERLKDQYIYGVRRLLPDKFLSEQDLRDINEDIDTLFDHFQSVYNTQGRLLLSKLGRILNKPGHDPEYMKEIKRSYEWLQRILELDIQHLTIASGRPNKELISEYFQERIVSSQAMVDNMFSKIAEQNRINREHWTFTYDFYKFNVDPALKAVMISCDHTEMNLLFDDILDLVRPTAKGATISLIFDKTKGHIKINAISHEPDRAYFSGKHTDRQDKIAKRLLQWGGTIELVKPLKPCDVEAVIHLTILPA
jgi:hypothetical protein